MPTSPNFFRVARRRLARKLKRRVPMHEVAAVLDVTPRAVGHYEAGRVAPPIHKAKELAEFLDVPASRVVLAIAAQARAAQARRLKARPARRTRK